MAGGSERDPLRRLDLAAFGLIYGAITVLSLLMAMGAHPDAPMAMAIALFGSVLAITLAKAFAEVIAESLETGRRLERPQLREAWLHSRPTLVAANLPAVLIAASAFGLLDVDRAIALSQGFCVLLLLLVGARVGWVAGGSWRGVALGALFTGGLGGVLAAMKYVLH